MLFLRSDEFEEMPLNYPSKQFYEAFFLIA